MGHADKKKGKYADRDEHNKNEFQDRRTFRSGPEEARQSHKQRQGTDDRYYRGGKDLKGKKSS